jgi:hypothetical protein
LFRLFFRQNFRRISVTNVCAKKHNFQIFCKLFCAKKHKAQFCSMERQLTPLEAWHDFYQWAKAQPFWADLEQDEKSRMYERNAAAKGQRKYPLRWETIKKTLTMYAPGRYRFLETVYLLER